MTVESILNFIYAVIIIKSYTICRKLRSKEQDRIREIIRCHKSHTRWGPIRIIYWLTSSWTVQDSCTHWYFHVIVTRPIVSDKAESAVSSSCDKRTVKLKYTECVSRVIRPLLIMKNNCSRILPYSLVFTSTTFPSVNRLAGYQV